MNKTIFLLDKKSLLEVCGPYLETEKRPNPEWITAIREDYLRNIRQANQLTIRTNEIIKDEYGSTYQKGMDWWDKHFAPLPESPLKPYIFDGEYYFGAKACYERNLIYYVREAINVSGASRILEVGSGSGRNLISMALTFPDRDFEGLELTNEGVTLANNLIAEEILSDNYSIWAGCEPGKTPPRENIKFTQGSAALLPYEDNHFDMVFSILALEQMRQILPDVLAEIRRVCSGNVIFVEPFADFNGPKDQEHIEFKGYFNLSGDELSAFGFIPLIFTSQILRKLHMGVGVYFGQVQK
ncbi:MAG: class I SAM-dependent methyltransferase [Rhodospirillales bacterium]|jgi:SAM-dependent methyltransferase|nr:class I SAM-dependent methyltransferase [Rhodospirillales bacterium]